MHFHTALDYTNCIPCVQYTETVSNVVIGYRLVAEWSCINTRKSHGSGDPSSSITREEGSQSSLSLILQKHFQLSL